MENSVVTGEKAALGADKKAKKRTNNTPVQRIENCTVLIEKKRGEIKKLQSEIKELECKIADIQKREEEKKFRELNDYLKENNIDPAEELRRLKAGKN